MGEWVDTQYGKRYKEDYGTCTAFFMTEPNEDKKRELPFDVWEIILEAVLAHSIEDKKD